MSKPTVVYLVEYGEYEQRSVYGVFTSQAKAEAFIAAGGADNAWVVSSTRPTITEYPLDPAPDEVGP